MTDEHWMYKAPERYLCINHATSINARTLEAAYRLYAASGRYVSPMYEQYADPTFATTDRRCEARPAGAECGEIYRWRVEDHYTSDIRQSHVQRASEQA
jgi:hypothetical protein